ncbi:neutral zinc metallopeptidase [Algirhabdus cladophorae]|uniref:KPN_02809 family neutral zinc metallopeptidase n=1 Tax=Algirhabdus cladophorae TaxID=3377108 RepID=UPI003B84B36D
MKWQGRRGSRNIEDRRGSSGRSGGRASGGAKLGGVGLLAVVLIGYFLGIDVSPLLNGENVQTSAGSAEITEADQQAAQFVSVTLADTEEVWSEIFRTQVGQAYTPATLVLFKGATASPCGGASGASGPFYCPADKKAYLDTDFFTTLSRRLGASGDFAAAYVVAHEIAHHVQNELGILGQANRIRQQSSQAESNAISVRIELQADCYSGIWARYAQDRLGTVEKGDLAEALNAAKQIGDDTLQFNAGQRPNPHTFTHGTSQQRQDWFERGYQTADIRQCDTFSAQNL